jgi:hypothetical protein
MFCMPQACVCRVAMTTASPPKVRGGGALEEAVVGASCRAAVMTLTLRAVAVAYSSLRRRAMVRACMRLSGLLLGGLEVGHLVRDALL